MMMRLLRHRMNSIAKQALTYNIYRLHYLHEPQK